MSTPSRSLLGAMFAQLTAWLWFIARTTPGLVLITLGSLAPLVGRPWWGLAVIGLGAMLYAEQCGRTPYAPCIRCEGTGHHRKHATRVCHWCRGKGVRMRWGRTVMNTYRRATYASGTYAPVATTARPLAPGTYADALRQNTSHHGEGN